MLVCMDVTNNKLLWHSVKHAVCLEGGVASCIYFYFQEELVEMGACDIHTAYKLVGQSFMKLVEEHQSRNSSSLKTIEVPNSIDPHRIS